MQMIAPNGRQILVYTWAMAVLFMAIGVQTTLSQDSSPGLIDQAAAAHAAIQQKGGLDGVKMGMAECWRNAERKPSIDAAVYCSAFHFAAAALDEVAVATIGAPPTVSMGEATARARKVLLAAGMPKESIPQFITLIRQQAISASNRVLGQGSK